MHFSFSPGPTHLSNVDVGSASALRQADVAARRPYQSVYEMTLAIIAGSFCPVFVAFAQDITPTPQTAGPPIVTAVEVIVTGSNIPTAEEVTPQPDYLLNRDEIFRLGVRHATDLVQQLPTVTGPSIYEH